MQETLPDDCFDESGKRLKVQPEFSLKSIQEGRKNYKAYSFFFDKFVPLLEKKKSDFNGKLKTAKQMKALLPSAVRPLVCFFWRTIGTGG